MHVHVILFFYAISVPHQQCAVGFLNGESRRMIVQDVTSNPPWAPTTLNFPGISPLATSIPLTNCGPLRKIVIAAKFNVTVPVGWPKLEIIRRASNGTPCIAFSTNMTEPKPTGYLNAYEYDLSTKNFTIQAGDALNISWYGDVLQQDQIRFSLAYNNNGIPSGMPMVSVIVDAGGSNYCDPTHDWLGQPNLNLYCEEITEHQPVTNGTVLTKTTLANTQASTVTEITNITTMSTSQRITKINVTAVISGVVSCFLLLSLLLILVIICVIVVRQREKSFLVDTADSTEMNRYMYEARPFQNTTSKIENFDLSLIFMTFSRKQQGSSFRK